MTDIEKAEQAIRTALGEQHGCNSDRCCCWGSDQVLECHMGVSVNTLAQAVVNALSKEEKPDDPIQKVP